MLIKFLSQITRRHLLTGLALILMGYVGFSTIGIIAKNYQLQQQVDKLHQEIDLLSLQNQELEYKIAYYRTDAFAEKEARDKLGLQAPGETVVIFPEKVPKGVEIPKEELKDESFSAQAASNFEQWMYFLFKREPN